MSSENRRMPSSQGQRSRSSSGGRSRTPTRKSRRPSVRSRKSSRGPSRKSSSKRGRISSTKNSHIPSEKESRSLTESDKQETFPTRADSSSSSSYSLSESGEHAGRISKSTVCNLIFPVARVKSMLKVHNHGLRISDKTAVFTAGVLEYMATEILELSMNAARDDGRVRIKPRHVNTAIKTDKELFRNFKNSTVPTSTFISLDQMASSASRVRGSDQSVALPGPSTAPQASTVSSERRKSDKRGRSRREG